MRSGPSAQRARSPARRRTVRTTKTLSERSPRRCSCAHMNWSTVWRSTKARYLPYEVREHTRHQRTIGSDRHIQCLMCYPITATITASHQRRHRSSTNLCPCPHHQLSDHLCTTSRRRSMNYSTTSRHPLLSSTCTASPPPPSRKGSRNCEHPPHLHAHGHS